MARSFFALLAVRPFGSRVWPRRRFTRFAPLAIALATGCHPSADNLPSDRVKVLEQEKENLQQEKEDLQQKLQASQAAHLQAVTVIRDTIKKLEEMPGAEVEIRLMQGELEPATFATQAGVREQIFSKLNFLQQSLEMHREQSQQAATVVEEQGLLDVYRETIDYLKHLLEQRDQEIKALYDRMSNLERQATELRQQVEENRAATELLYHRQEDRAAPATPEFRRSLEDSAANPIHLESRPRNRLLADEERRPFRLRARIGSAYCFVGSPEEIDAAFNRREILAHGRTYQISETFLMDEGLPRVFRAISPGQSEIYLGPDLRHMEILSTHKWHKDLFDFAQDESGGTVLRIYNPAAFWNIDSYLIIEIER